MSILTHHFESHLMFTCFETQISNRWASPVFGRWCWTISNLYGSSIWIWWLECRRRDIDRCQWCRCRRFIWICWWNWWWDRQCWAHRNWQILWWRFCGQRWQGRWTLSCWDVCQQCLEWCTSWRIQATDTVMKQSRRRWSSMELIEVGWWNHWIGCQLWIAKCSQTCSIELLSKVESQVCEWIWW